MNYYSESEAYDELREDFIDEFKDQLQVRDKGEELKLVAEGTPFEAITLKDGGELVCPSIPMELVYLNCYVTESIEIDEAATYILGIFDEVEWIPRNQLEQIAHVLIYPMNLAEYQDKLVEGNIAYMPYQDMAVTFRFWIEKEEKSYCGDVTEEHLETWGIGVEELFEKVRYRDLKEIGVDIVNMYDSLTSRFENDQSIFLRPTDGVPIALKEMYQVYGMNGFGAVWYPRVMEQLHEILGNEMLIVPHDVYCAYIQTPKLGSVSELQEELQVDNEVKAAYGEGRHIMSEQIFKYDLDKRNLVPAVEAKKENKIRR